MAGMTKRKAAATKTHNTIATRKVFLAELALSANVTAAASAAGMTTTAAYRQRSSDAQFRADWHGALCEGYARLETELLAEALTPASGRVGDATLKARAQRQRLALALLTAHRAAVRGERSITTVVHADETKGAKARLIEKVEAMAARLAGDGAANAMPTVAE